MTREQGHEGSETRQITKKVARELCSGGAGEVEMSKQRAGRLINAEVPFLWRWSQKRMWEVRLPRPSFNREFACSPNRPSHAHTLARSTSLGKQDRSEARAREVITQSGAASSVLAQSSIAKLPSPTQNILPFKAHDHQISANTCDYLSLAAIPRRPLFFDPAAPSPTW